MQKILWSQLRTWILIFNINSKQSQKLCNRRKKKIIDYKKKTTYCPIALWYIGVLDFPVHFLRCDIPSLSCYGETCRLDALSTTFGINLRQTVTWTRTAVGRGRRKPRAACPCVLTDSRHTDAILVVVYLSTAAPWSNTRNLFNLLK